MSRLTKRLLIALYLGTSGAILVNYLLGLNWFGRYDKIVTWGFIAIAGLFGGWLKSRRERKVDAAEPSVEALDSEGAVRSDPKTQGYIRLVIGISTGICVLVWVSLGYRRHWSGQFQANAVTLLVMVVVFIWVFWRRFGNISQVESDDGATLTLVRGGNINQIPWSQVESVEVNRPYAFWQVTVSYRQLGDSKVQTARFLPMGWRKMTPGMAEKLRAALDSRSGVH